MRVLALGGALALILLAAANAHADFTSDAVVSGSTTVESDYAFDPVISADGRYVAYTGSQTGVPGIYRKDLQTGGLDFVAGGDAGAPSISADGRYVSFTTTATDPAMGTGQGCSSVYVRDMSLPSDVPVAYALASALPGTVSGLTYAGSSAGGCPGGGSASAPGVALSADGSEVAFTVVGKSNLTGPAGNTDTPPAQVAVRHLDTLQTTLVSQTMASLGNTPQPVAGGAAMTDNSTGAGVSAGTTNAAAGDSTAAISADGSTVAWLGIDIPAQAPASSSDLPQGHPDEYDEPLWRRIADGPAAPIRRILGGDDESGPCAASPCAGPLDTQWNGPADPVTGDTGPERGSFIAYQGFTGAGLTSASGLEDVTPKLSADGQTVAVLSTQPATGQDPVYGTKPPANVTTDAYVVNMADGLSRDSALTRVTQWASSNFSDISLAGPVDGLAISPEGLRVAFVTRRTVFPYSPPALITPQLSSVGYAQMYVADLDLGVMQMASSGYDGAPANGYVATPAFSANNGPITFASAATNLVYGAFSGLQGGAEIFTTTEVKPPAVPGGQQIGPPPANRPIVPRWVIGATVRRMASGAIVLDVSVPGGGRVRVTAQAAVPIGPARHGRLGPAGHGRRRHRGARGRVARRTLASASTRSGAAGIVSLTLRPPARYRPLIARAHGLYATVTVRFASRGHATVSQMVPADFVARSRARRGGRRR